MQKQLIRIKDFCIYVVVAGLLIALFKSFTYMKFIPILLAVGLILFFLGISISVFRERVK